MILLNTQMGRSHPFPPTNKTNKGDQKSKQPRKNEKFPDRKGPYMGIKVNENLFTHQHAPVWIAKKQFKEDEDVIKQLYDHKNRYLYEVADVKRELESLTEDEADMESRKEKE